MAVTSVMYGGPFDGQRTVTDQDEVTYILQVTRLVGETIIPNGGELIRYLITPRFDRQGCRIFRYEHMSPDPETVNW